MCEICDGTATYDELRARREARIEEYGWTLQGVEDGPENVSWVYTIGLIESRQHPELVLPGMKFEVAVGVLSRLAERVMNGDRFDAVPVAVIDGMSLGFRAVHPKQFEYGLCDQWLDQYRAFTDVLELDALQVLLPPSMFCPDHQEQLRLDRPADVLRKRPMRRAMGPPVPGRYARRRNRRRC